MKKKLFAALALMGTLIVSKSPAVSLDDLQFWSGSGTNRAALVVEWSTPESFAGTTVPAPVADKILVWGYRFNGTATGTQMLKAILAADPRLYLVVDETYGTYVEGIDYNVAGNGAGGLTDGSTTNFFNHGLLTDPTVEVDAAAPLNHGDLYWGGYYGPNWEVWTEAGDAGGFLNAPDRGTNPYWTPDDVNAPYSGFHGQWELAQAGLDGLALTNGSWIGFSVAAGSYVYGSVTAPYDLHKHAPSLPDASLTFTPSPVQSIAAGTPGQVQFSARTNWWFTLERTVDFQGWMDVSVAMPGVMGNLVLQDTNPPADQAFYRVRADRP